MTWIIGIAASLCFLLFAYNQFEADDSLTAPIKMVYDDVDDPSQRAEARKHLENSLAMVAGKLNTGYENMGHFSAFSSSVNELKND